MWPTGFVATPRRCNCFGDGCDTLAILAYKDYYNDYFTHEYDMFNGQTDEEQLGPSSFSVNSNSFTFFFIADTNHLNGHVIFDWECVESSLEAWAPT